ncbi:MAG: single-stranded DNA-binding protein [Leifsonia sp.]|nr:single-stranded DNA-binding protein [Leifsonia sp.]|tara:strand:+ start:54488 stop:54970 length:483 start_codon:yes stop_codon:yes gene_type:complete
MSDQITVTGLVATIPRHLVTGEGLPITSFRLASTQRRYDRSQQRWVDGETNWFTITSFRQIALNVNASVQKGQRVVVTGRLRVRDWESGEKVGTTVDIDVDAIGHDLAWGTASFTRSVASSVTAEAAADPRPEPESGDEEGAAAGAAEEEATREPVATPF